MCDKKNECKIDLMDIQIGVTIVLCLLLCHVAGLIGLQIQALAACTGAVMCAQDSTTGTYKASLNRILGVVCGGVTGLAIVFIDNAVGIPCVFYLLCGVGVVINLFLCKTVKMMYVQARVSCMTLLLVVLVLQGAARVNYALGRFIGTLVGAVVALLVTWFFIAVFQKKSKSNMAPR